MAMISSRITKFTFRDMNDLNDLVDSYRGQDRPPSLLGVTDKLAAGPAVTSPA